MTSFFTFMKKELLEQWRNYKILILISVLFVFGMMSPLLAKLMPEMFSQMDLGVEITIPTPTAIDAYAQFFKNMTQMGIIMLVLVFGGNLPQELSKGTAIIMFSKGLSRTAFIMAKFTAMVLLWTVGYTLSAVTCFGYTVSIFKGSAPDMLIPSFTLLWLFVIFVLAIITLAGTITRGSYLPLLLTAGALGIMLIIDMFPKVAQFSPLALANSNVDLLTGAKSMSDLLWPCIITGFLICAFITVAITSFRKKQI